MSGLRLSGKVAVITGAASGIGEASAHLFAREGAKVVAADINESCSAVVEKINSNGGDAVFVKTDVTKTSDIEKMIGAAVMKWGRLDVLFNNAGVSIDSYITDVDEQLWDTLININLKGVFFGCKYAFKQMLTQKTGGSIINTSSIMGLLSLPRTSAYGASKAGVIGVTRALSVEGGPHKIRVNCLCPGFVLTGMTRAHLSQTDPGRDLEIEAKFHPISRVGMPEDIAQAALFLASDESSFITGCMMPVDGGLSGTEVEFARTFLPV